MRITAVNRLSGLVGCRDSGFAADIIFSADPNICYELPLALSPLFGAGSP